MPNLGYVIRPLSIIRAYAANAPRSPSRYDVTQKQLIARAAAGTIIPLFDKINKAIFIFITTKRLYSGFFFSGIIIMKKKIRLKGPCVKMAFK